MVAGQIKLPRTVVGLLAFLFCFVGIVVFTGGQGKALDDADVCSSDSDLNKRICGVSITTIVLGFLSVIILAFDIVLQNFWLGLLLSGPFTVATAFLGTFVVAYGYLIDQNFNNTQINTAFVGALFWYIGVGLMLIRLYLPLERVDRTTTTSSRA